MKTSENPVKEMMAMVTDSNVLNILELTLLLQNCNLSILLFIHAFIHCSDARYLHPKYSSDTTPVAADNIYLSLTMLQIWF